MYSITFVRNHQYLEIKNYPGVPRVGEVMSLSEDENDNTYADGFTGTVRSVTWYRDGSLVIDLF